MTLRDLFKALRLRELQKIKVIKLRNFNSLTPKLIKKKYYTEYRDLYGKYTVINYNDNGQELSITILKEEGKI